MSVLVYDLETTGLYHFDRGPGDPNQPRVVEIAAALFSPQWETMAYLQTFFRPDGWVSSAGAKSVHGISERQANIYGARAKAALACFMDMVRAAREIASYNLAFDEGCIDVELHRCGAAPVEWKRSQLRRTCIMELAAHKFNGGRQMKMEEAHRRATGFPYDVVHRAGPDLQAAVRIIRAIREE